MIFEYQGPDVPGAIQQTEDETNRNPYLSTPTGDEEYEVDQRRKFELRDAAYAAERAGDMELRNRLLTAAWIRYERPELGR